MSPTCSGVHSWPAAGRTVGHTAAPAARHLGVHPEGASFLTS